MRKYTEAQKKSAKKWDAENLDRVSVALPKGMKADIKAAIGEGGSVNGFIREAVEARLNGTAPTTAAENAPETPQEATGAILKGGAVCLPSEEEKSAQNAPEAEIGRTACSVKSDIYEAAAVAAGKKSVSINDFIDSWLEIGARDDEKLIRAQRIKKELLQKPKEST